MIQKFLETKITPRAYSNSWFVSIEQTRLYHSRIFISNPISSEM